MVDFLFYLFSAITVLSAFLVVVNRDAVNGAMFMIISFVGMACLFLMLDAPFLAVLQILVYAGAVMVLFLFIIMLLDVKAAGKLNPDRLTVAASAVGFLLLGCGVTALFLNGNSDAPALPITAAPELPMIVPEGVDPATKNPMEFSTAPRSFGYGLFTKYMLPFQLTGFLLLVAMMGVIVLSKQYLAPGQGDNKVEAASAE